MAQLERSDPVAARKFFFDRAGDMAEISGGETPWATLVAGLRMTGMLAPMVFDGPINRDWFEADVGQILVPDLRRGDVVIIDNLSSHKRDAV